MPPSTQHSPFPQQSPHHVHGSCRGSLAIPFPILYFTSIWLFYNYLFVLLNHLISSPFPIPTVPSGNHQNALRIHDLVFVLLLCLVCFLESIVDRYIYCHFIVHSFHLFLKETPLTFHIIMA